MSLRNQSQLTSCVSPAQGGFRGAERTRTAVWQLSADPYVRDRTSAFFDAVYARREDIFAGATTRIYFMQEGRGHVKIGQSKQALTQRLRAMQTGNSSELRVLACAPGTTAIEKLLHSILAADNVRGEWFKASPPVLALAREFAEIEPRCFVPQFPNVVSSGWMQNAYLDRARELNPSLPPRDDEWDQWEADDD